METHRWLQFPTAELAAATVVTAAAATDADIIVVVEAVAAGVGFDPAAVPVTVDVVVVGTVIRFVTAADAG